MSEVGELLSAARAAAKAGELDEAARLLTEILERDPDNVGALDTMGFVLYFERMYPEAEQVCRRTIEVSPDHAFAHKGLGLCLAAQGRVDEGVVELERAIELEPGWPDPYWDLAVVLERAGRLREAMKVLARGQVAAPRARARFQRYYRRLTEKLGAR